MGNAPKDFASELKQLGLRIRQIRKHRKLRLLDLEVLSGINDSDISRFEKGRGNIEFLTIYKLARALEVDVVVLMDYDGPLPTGNFKGLSKIEKSKRKK
jgi:transcriptional regulator with XRE-family HTH domain